MKDIKITVYIVSHNYGRYLQEAIESVLRQTTGKWELLIIDDNSTDNTQEVAALYRNDRRIKILTTKGLGLPSVANLASRLARGEYIIRLDADDVFDENILLVLSNYLDRHPEAAFIFPDYYLVDQQGEVIHCESRQRMYQNNHLLDIPANGACTMIRKTVLLEIGGYREDLGAQDGFDLWTKVLRKHKCANVNLPLFYYRRHGENLTDNHIRIFTARRAIKKDAVKAKLEENRPVIAVIPCRKNYDFVPNLWNKKLGKKTLLDIAVQTCLASSVFDKVVVTSDTDTVKKYLAKYRDPRLSFVKRSSESTLNSRSIVSTLEHITSVLGCAENGITVLSYIQAPFTTTEMLEEAVFTLLLNDTDSAFAVEEIKENVFKRTSFGLMPINFQGRVKSDFDFVFKEIMASLAARHSNFKTGSLTGSRVSYFTIPKDEIFFIQTKRDYEIAKILKRQRKK